MASRQSAPGDSQSSEVLPLRAAVRVAQSTSRRGFLAWAARALLAASGLTLAEQLLPADRRVPADATHGCGDWYQCGLYGYPCGCCNNYQLCVCSDGSYVGSYWEEWCYNPSLGYACRVRYYDCCGKPSPCSCAPFCANNPDPQQLWCSGGYYCTTTCIYC